MHLGVVSFEELKQFHFNGIAAVPDYSFSTTVDEYLLTSLYATDIRHGLNITISRVMEFSLRV